jgi:hypothetical protein
MSEVVTLVAPFYVLGAIVRSVAVLVVNPISTFRWWTKKGERYEVMSIHSTLMVAHSLRANRVTLIAIEPWHLHMNVTVR